MSDETSPYGIVLSHSAKDKAAVRPLAERLSRDGRNAWLDAWGIPARGSFAEQG